MTLRVSAQNRHNYNVDTRHERARQPPITTVSQKPHIYPGDPSVLRENRRNEFRDQLKRDYGFYIVSCTESGTQRKSNSISNAVLLAVFRTKP